MNNTPYQLPPDLRELRRQIELRRLAHQVERQQAEARAAQPATLVRGRYYPLSALAMLLGIPRDQIYQALSGLTRRKGGSNGTTWQIKADRHLKAYCDRCFIPIRLTRKP